MPELIIINGEEDFLKERTADNEISSRLIENVIKYNYSDIDQYLEEIRTPLLFGGSRAFLINECKQVPVLPDGQDILILISGKKKIEDKRASIVHDFPTLKTYSNNNEVIKWIIKEGNSLNIDLSRVATALFMNNGKSLRKLYSEIRKLAVMLPSGGTITPEIARSLLCFSAELTPKDIIESICDGNTLKSLAFYDKLQQNADETGWIIAYMQRHVIQFIKIESLSSRGMKSGDIASNINIHPFVFKQIYESRIGNWTISSLQQSLSYLCELDLLHKCGSRSADFGLETEIIRLSEEAKNVRQRNN